MHFAYDFYMKNLFAFIFFQVFHTSEKKTLANLVKKLWRVKSLEKSDYFLEFLPMILLRHLTEFFFTSVKQLKKI